MKTKTFALALAALLSATALTACTDNDKHVTFTEYWQKDWAVTEQINETLTYKVTFSKGAGIDAIGYQLSYGEGSYVTTLVSNSQGYTYTTSLSMPVSYEFNGTKEEFTDTVTTEVVFSRASDALRPISSKKTVVSHTPANGNPAKVDDCYVHFHFNVNTTYPTTGDAHSIVTYEKTSDNSASVVESNFSFATGDYSYLDNEQLLLALRAIPNDTTSGSLEAYNPFVKRMQSVNFSFSAATGADFTYSVDGTSKTQNISYRPVTLVLNDKNPGATQTAWIAATASDTSKNFNRNVMLRLETPLSYSLGSLVYTLTSTQN